MRRAVAGHSSSLEERVRRRLVQTVCVLDEEDASFALKRTKVRLALNVAGCVNENRAFVGEDQTDIAVRAPDDLFESVPVIFERVLEFTDARADRTLAARLDAASSSALSARASQRESFSRSRPRREQQRAGTSPDRDAADAPSRERYDEVVEHE